MDIRKAEKNDFAEVYELWKKAGLAIAEKGQEQKEYELLMEKNPDFCLIAEDEGKIVGTVLGSWNGRTAWIYHLAVKPEHQGQGLGSELLGELEKRLKRANVTRVRLGIYTPELIPFYEKFGYAVIKDTIFMGKQIT